MEVIRDPENCSSIAGGTAVTIGAYDGVHLGHRAVIRQVQQLAAAAHLHTAVVTFDRHPASVVRPDSAPKLLTDLEQKLELLGELGVDYTMVVPFDEARSREPAADFVGDVLHGCLQAKAIVVGEDFHFGHRRSGNVELLRDMGATLGFEVRGIDLVGLHGDPATDDAPVSSTRIRAALAEGDLDAANDMLGRPHEVRGVVAHGDGRATDLGYPTANVSVPDEICLPADGIYAGEYVRPDGSVVPAALSLGRRPTFYETQPFSLLEAHLLDFSGDLYDEPASVRFIRRLREERKFDSVDALVEQIGRDCDEARVVLGLPPRPPGT